MLPTDNGLLSQDIEFVEDSSYTFFLDIDKNLVYNFTDQLEAMKQAIYLIINTERYQYVIFSWNYGIELDDLFGQPISYILPEIKRRIQEALLQDTRIEAVDNFEFTVTKGVVFTTFTAHTIFGDIPIEKGVNF
jgi:hypothetical protein